MKNKFNKNGRVKIAQSKNMKTTKHIKFIFILTIILLFNSNVFSQIGRNTSALLGEVTTADDCSAEHQAFNDDIMMFGRIAVSTQAFEECVREKVTNLYRKCNGDPFYDSSIEDQIQKVIEISRSLNNVHIKCTGGSGNASSSIGEYGRLTDESFSWGGWFSGVYDQLGKRTCDLAAGERPDTDNCRWADYPWPYSQAAGIVWHEVMHQQGYTHGANDQINALVNCGYAGDATWNFQVNTMPYIIGNCISDIIGQSGNACNLNDCDGSNQLQTITHYNGTECKCVNDPAKKGIGILKLDNNQLTDESVKSVNDWIGGWRIGIEDNLVASGDFNGDNIDDYIVTSGWGIGILTYNGIIWKPIVVQPNGSGFGGWNFNSRDNKIVGVGDFNGDGKDDFVITSNWGIGILTVNGSTLSALMIKPKDNWFNQWRYDASVNRGKDIIQGIGDFDNDNKDEILITSSWGIGILELRDNSLYSIVAKPNGTRFGSWNFNSADNKIKGVGDFNGDGKDDFVITSGWGIGILTVTGSTLSTLMIKPKDTWFNQWRYDASVNRGKDKIQGIGDFDNDNRDEILITSSWGIGVLELRDSSLYSIVAKPNGTRFGNWNFNTVDNKVKGVGDFNGDGKDDFVITSDWGIGILTISGSSFSALNIKPNGTLCGSWILDKKDNIAQIDNFAAGRNSKILVQKKN
ncbi:ABC-type uncharacterized transport system, permease component [Aequorivita sublithincola DSM 14238]|uniref:ABC-type uncharacterized transport system, permease component n=1 Tax=Aequorivita sublithincola (strain DSM 14238 / LMG 21431 / ACAM 643 / 9-3) TaxID=746697 RepID=I3YW06_AEQSU|nr:VCBS repeat-containing protein [Aequorivita sublithincola]AFL81174.1 ABC-type uncharacterized transport system, permease component [Aequorivita sublithincola DSM 14238]